MFRRTLVLALISLFPSSVAAAPGSCPQTTPPPDCTALPPTTSDPSALTVSSCQLVSSGTYQYANVNVIEGGTLFFVDDGGAIIFNVKSLLVEQGGAVQAGTWCQPFGVNGGTLEIGLWGDDPTLQATVPNPQDLGISCVGNGGQCYPPSRVGACCTGTDSTDPCQATCAANHSQDNALFEGYHNLHLDPNFFGYKVLGVSYGGSLQLFGAKGVATVDRVDPSLLPTNCPVPPLAKQTDPTAWAVLTGGGWARLNATAAIGATTLTLDRDVDWAPGDQVVVATTDWFPSHSELVTVAESEGSAVTLGTSLAFPHNGALYTVPAELGTKAGNANTKVETRAAVGLLSRSIVIRSLGREAGEAFPTASACTSNQPDCYFGGHVIARQGFASFQLQGVELYQLGQGGRMGHYPVHFHEAKSTAYTLAFVKDSSIWDSNTRFITLHATHDTTLARNVGYLSMGHGFYLEDGSEIDNLLCQNLGVTARPSFVEYFGAQPPTSPAARFIPPILETMQDDSIQGSDSVYPSMFWLMNTYNELVGNQAVGVEGFGACYWPLSSSVSGSSVNLHWARSNSANPTYQSNSTLDYANFNSAGARQAPLKRFRGNGCSTAAYAFMTERQALQPTIGPPLTGITPVASPYQSHMAPADLPNVQSNFYPSYFVPPCPANPTSCQATNPTCTPAAPTTDTLNLNSTYCVTSILDRFTTSFNWAQANFGSVWLRPWNYVFLNSAITDQLFGGLGFVSGGSWEQVLPGYLALTQDSVFVGSTQPTSSTAGPLGPDITQAQCGYCQCSQPPCSPACPVAPPCGPNPSCISQVYDFCRFSLDGIGVYAGGFNPKRLITIYDGPFFSGGSVFTGISPFTCNLTATDCGIYLSTNQPVDPTDSTQMQVIDAAIGWKQPNGFYYPPAFAFAKSAFDATSERHNVFDQYQNYWQGTLSGGTPITMPLPSFGGNSPIDFGTILNDLDGSLNGVEPTGSGPPRTAGLSNNHFYDTPFQAPECNSFGTNTVPQDFVTTVMANLTALPVGTTVGYVNAKWGNSILTPMVPIYRQLKTGEAADACASPAAICNESAPGCQRGSFMMGAQNGAAPSLTVNGGTYFLDTSCSSTPNNGLCQSTACFSPPPVSQVAPFVPGDTYGVFHLFATSETAVTYQLYVGTSFDASTLTWVQVDPHLSGTFPATDQVSAAAGPFGTSSFDSSTGVLTVTLDNSTAASSFEYGAVPTPQNCQPSDICRPGATGCVGNPDYPEKDLADALNEVCGFWVDRRYGQSKDGVFLSDCPAGGCLGFAFTLPASFTPVSYQTAGLQLASCYPNAAPWNVGLSAREPECAAGLPASGSFCND